MGFMKPSVPSSPPVETTPPVVAEVAEADTKADYNQKASRKKGLLSTILTAPRRGGAMAAASNANNATLG